MITTSLFVSALDLLRPSKSPHLISITVGTISLVFLGLKPVSQSEFWYIAIPIYITMFILVYFSFKDVPDADEIKDEESRKSIVEGYFRLSRTLGIATSIGGMVFAAVMISKSKSDLFFVSYCIATSQLLVFLAYSAIRLFKEEEESRLKIVEISLITNVLLIGTIYCITQIDIDSETGIKFKEESLRYTCSSIALFCLWLVYEGFWLARIASLFKVEIR